MLVKHIVCIVIIFNSIIKTHATETWRCPKISDKSVIELTSTPSHPDECTLISRSRDTPTKDMTLICTGDSEFNNVINPEKKIHRGVRNSYTFKNGYLGNKICAWSEEWITCGNNLNAVRLNRFTGVIYDHSYTTDGLMFNYQGECSIAQQKKF